MSDWPNTIEGFMKVCVMMLYLHCCSIIVGSLPFICTVKWHVCEPAGLIDRLASDMPHVNQGVGVVFPDVIGSSCKIKLVCFL